MSKTIQYITSEGERWDTVSFKVYGTPFEIDRLIQANPNVPVTSRLKGGTVLEVPVMEEYTVTPDKELLPPWKR
ncbi:MAG: tail protein X [Bacteroidetes bacterium]|nr:tail protein X [Bacteroidota bacterium]